MNEIKVKQWRSDMLTRYEKVERVAFLLAIIVLLLDVFIWRP